MAKTTRNPKTNARAVVRPTGLPLGWTPGSIAELAEVTDANKVDAVAEWRRNAPRATRDLLDARPRRRQRPNGSDDR
jgi:hypothetical protein